MHCSYTLPQDEHEYSECSWIFKMLILLNKKLNCLDDSAFLGRFLILVLSLGELRMANRDDINRIRNPPKYFKAYQYNLPSHTTHTSFVTVYPIASYLSSQQLSSSHKTYTIFIISYPWTSQIIKLSIMFNDKISWKQNCMLWRTMAHGLQCPFLEVHMQMNAKESTRWKFMQITVWKSTKLGLSPKDKIERIGMSLTIRRFIVLLLSKQ